MTILGALGARGLVQRCSDKEVRTGEDPSFRAVRETGFAADGAVFLRIGFVKHDSGEALTLEITEAARLGGKFFQHTDQLARMQGGQPGFQGVGAGLVVESSEQGQVVVADWDDAIAVAAGVPDAFDCTAGLDDFFLDAGHGA